MDLAREAVHDTKGSRGRMTEGTIGSIGIEWTEIGENGRERDPWNKED